MAQLERIRTPCAQMSLRLQAAFGLCREASIKIVLVWADRGETLVLKDSWNKGGREIRLPIRTPEQRQLLNEAKAVAMGKSLVAPGYTTYREYRAGRHSRLPRASAFVRPDPLPGNHRLGVPGALGSEVEGAHAETEGRRSRRSRSDRP